MTGKTHVWVDTVGRFWSLDSTSDLCARCGQTPDAHRRECGTPLGQRLAKVERFGGERRLHWEPYSCGRPASVRGEDGRMRCVQHDRMARGLSGKWTVA